MTITATSVHEGRTSMPVSKLGQRRQVVIPKEIWDSLDLMVGDFVEVEQVKGSIVLKPKKLVDALDLLTPEEEALVRRGEEELRTGEYVTLEQLEHDMGRKARQSRRKTTRKTSS
jgi:AbrB family looped-hinge helix DNA binding protein